jgi:phospholipase C
MKQRDGKRKFQMHRLIGWAALGLVPLIFGSPPAHSAGSEQDRPVVSAPVPSATERLPIDAIEHIVVIYLENRSFDNLFGMFPGANGLSNAGPSAIQVDASNVPYATLPPVVHPTKKKVDERFPKDLPNRPFLIDRFVAPDQLAYMIPASFFEQYRQVNGGRMDKFALHSPSGGLIMGYHDISKLGLWQLAKEYTLADNYFKGTFGGSFVSHFWIACVCIPRLENPPPSSMAQFAPNGVLIKDGNITPDGYILDDMEPQTLHQPGRDPKGLLAGQFMPTIGDRLSDRGVSWAWYSEGWNDAVAGRAPATFKFRHQAYAYFARYALGTAEQMAHLKDEADLLRDIAMEIISALQRSDAWKKTAIIITFDDNGGYWDHVPPPRIDRWGPGLRVPTIVVSPFAKKGYVDHTFYELTSILKLIEMRFRLEPLGERDANASPMLNVFDFGAEGQ